VYHIPPSFTDDQFTVNNLAKTGNPLKKPYGGGVTAEFDTEIEDIFVENRRNTR